MSHSHDNTAGGRGMDTPLSDKEKESFAKEIILAHNKYRDRHGVPPIKLNKELCKASQSYAEHLAQNEQMVHRENNPYGQNIFYSWSSNPKDDVSGCTVVRSWYDEERGYKFYGKEPPIEEIARVGHFTQVIWKDTKEIGVGRARSKQGAWYVVVDYDPKGNWINEFKENVLRPAANKARSCTSVAESPTKPGPVPPHAPESSKHLITTIPPPAPGGSKSSKSDPSVGEPPKQAPPSKTPKEAPPPAKAPEPRALVVTPPPKGSSRGSGTEVGKKAPPTKKSSPDLAKKGPSKGSGPDLAKKGPSKGSTPELAKIEPLKKSSPDLAKKGPTKGSSPDLSKKGPPAKEPAKRSSGPDIAKKGPSLSDLAKGGPKKSSPDLSKKGPSKASSPDLAKKAPPTKKSSPDLAKKGPLKSSSPDLAKIEPLKPQPKKSGPDLAKKAPAPEPTKKGPSKGSAPDLYKKGPPATDAPLKKSAPEAKRSREARLDSLIVAKEVLDEEIDNLKSQPPTKEAPPPVVVAPIPTPPPPPKKAEPAPRALSPPPAKKSGSMDSSPSSKTSEPSTATKTSEPSTKSSKVMEPVAKKGAGPEPKKAVPSQPDVPKKIVKSGEPEVPKKGPAKKSGPDPGVKPAEPKKQEPVKTSSASGPLKKSGSAPGKKAPSLPSKKSGPPPEPSKKAPSKASMVKKSLSQKRSGKKSGPPPSETSQPKKKSGQGDEGRNAVKRGGKEGKGPSKKGARGGLNPETASTTTKESSPPSAFCFGNKPSKSPDKNKSSEDQRRPSAEVPRSKPEPKPSATSPSSPTPRGGAAAPIPAPPAPAPPAPPAKPEPQTRKPAPPPPSPPSPPTEESPVAEPDDSSYTSVSQPVQITCPYCHRVSIADAGPFIKEACPKDDHSHPTPNELRPVKKANDPQRGGEQPPPPHPPVAVATGNSVTELVKRYEKEPAKPASPQSAPAKGSSSNLNRQPEEKMEIVGGHLVVRRQPGSTTELPTAIKKQEKKP